MGGKIIWFLSFIFLYLSPLYGQTFQNIRIQHKSIRVEVVKSQDAQRRGLGHRRHLKTGHGMLFTYDLPEQRIFWMKGMLFPIDIIWINKNKIVHIERDVPPPSLMTLDSNLKTYGHGILADKVLEINSGESGRFRLGDKIYIF